MRPRGLVVLALVCVLAACGTPTTGAPAPPSASAAQNLVLPPRPRDIDLAGVDVCTLLTDQQRKELDLDRPWVRNDYTEVFYANSPVRGCSTRSSGQQTDLGITVSDRVGIEAWTTQKVEGTVTPISVNGFPAITSSPSDASLGFCTVAVDVGPHLVLDVQFGATGQPRPPQSVLCSSALRSAEMALTTITTALGR